MVWVQGAGLREGSGSCDLELVIKVSSAICSYASSGWLLLTQMT